MRWDFATASQYSLHALNLAVDLGLVEDWRNHFVFGSCAPSGSCPAPVDRDSLASIPFRALSLPSSRVTNNARNIFDVIFILIL